MRVTQSVFNPPPSTSQSTLIGVGVAWVGAILAFEVALGRATGASWPRILEDYDLAHGGLMPIGLLFLALAPSLAVRRNEQRRRQR